MNRKKSSDEWNIVEKIVGPIFMVLFVLFVLSFVVGVFFFGFAGFFKIFGVQYSSISSLIGFVVFYFILSFILDLFSLIFANTASAYFSGKRTIFIVRMVIECFFSWIALHTVDEFMESITIPLRTEAIAVFFIFLVEKAIDQPEKKKD